MALTGGVPRPWTGVLVTTGAVLLAACAGEAAPADFGHTTVVLRLDEGDYTMPRFSPSGDRVAFVRVDTAEGIPAMAVGVVELETGDREQLLSPRESLEYAFYGALPVWMDWRGPDTLVAGISDGDVSMMEVALHVSTGAIVEEVAREGGVDPLTESQERVRERLHDLRPRWPPGLLDHVARGAVALPGDRIVYQKRYAGEDQDLWLADLDRGTFQVILPADSTDTLLGGSVVAGDLAALLRGSPTRVSILFLRDGEVRVFGTYDASIWQSGLTPRRQGAETAFFLRLADPEGPLGGRLLALEPEGIREIHGGPDIDDADLTARRLAVSRRKGGTRILEVHAPSTPQ